MELTENPLWLLPADPASRSQYFLNSMLPLLGADAAPIRIAAVNGREAAADRREILLDGERSALRIYSIEDRAGSELILAQLCRCGGTALVHDHLFEAADSSGDHYPRQALLAADKLVFFNERALYDVQREVLGAAVSAPQLFLSGMPAVLTELPAMNGSYLILIADPGRAEQRAHKVLQAIATMKEPPPLYWLLQEGQHEAALLLAAESGLSAGYLGTKLQMTARNPERFIELSNGAAAAVLLSNSPFGDLSPYLELSFAAGVPPIVCDFSVGSTLPEDLAFKIDPGFSETAELARVFAAATELPFRLSLAAQLKRFAAERFDPATIAADLRAIISG